MKNTRKYNRICVLGGGLWGTALANHLAHRGSSIRLWEVFPELAGRLEESRRHPHIPGLKLSPGIRVTSRLEEAAAEAFAILVVLPSTAVRQTARALRPLLDARSARPAIVNASKGVERGSLRTMGEVLIEELPDLDGRVFTLSGPSFAREVVRGTPTKLVLAGPSGRLAGELRALLDGGAIRVEGSLDRTGVELGGSLKNVIAVGCGILDGLIAAGGAKAQAGAASGSVAQPGANTKAALIAQGIGEMGRLIERLGGRRETIYGLSGLGDLIATGTSPESRNRLLGEKLGSGKSLRRALKEIPTVAEGVESAQSAHELLHSCGLRAPLLEAIWGTIHRGRSPRGVLAALGFLR